MFVYRLAALVLISTAPIVLHAALLDTTANDTANKPATSHLRSRFQNHSAHWRSGAEDRSNGGGNHSAINKASQAHIGAHTTSTNSNLDKPPPVASLPAAVFDKSDSYHEHHDDNSDNTSEYTYTRNSKSTSSSTSLINGSRVVFRTVTPGRDTGCDAMFSQHLWLCYLPTSLCRCREDWRSRKLSTNAAIFAGSLRTLTFTAPTFTRYIMAPNDFDIDVIYVIPAHGMSNASIMTHIPLLQRHAMAYLIHSSNITETMEEYCKRKNRVYTSKLRALDDIQSRRSKGGIVDMWAQVSMANNIINNLAMARDNHIYKLVIKTRPDLIYITPLNLRDLINYKHFLDRPYFNEKNLLNDVKTELKSTLPNVHVLYPYETAVYFPPCSGFGGVTDRFFIGPPAYMNILLNNDWLKDWLTTNKALIDAVRPNVVNYKPYQPITGVEGYLQLWVQWNGIPVAELPAKDVSYNYSSTSSTSTSESSTSSASTSITSSTNSGTAAANYGGSVASTSNSTAINITGFVWMIIRTNHLLKYCDKAMFDQLHWTDGHCTFEGGMVNRYAVINRYFRDNQRMIKAVCDDYRHLLEPTRILTHRKCVIDSKDTIHITTSNTTNTTITSATTSDAIKKLSPCEFHVLWSDSEYSWETFDKLKEFKIFMQYLNNIPPLQ